MRPYPDLDDGTLPCQQIDPELFHPAPGESKRTTAVAQVIAVCQGCDFLAGCLGYALTHDVSGIWGGTTHLRRKQIRLEYGIDAEPVVSGLKDTTLMRERPA